MPFLIGPSWCVSLISWSLAPGHLLSEHPYPPANPSESKEAEQRLRDQAANLEIPGSDLTAAMNSLDF